MSTDKNTSVKIIISRLMAVYGLHKPKEAADKLGVTSQVLNNWISRESPAAMDKIREVIGGPEAEAIISGESAAADRDGDEALLPEDYEILARLKESPELMLAVRDLMRVDENRLFQARAKIREELEK